MKNNKKLKRIDNVLKGVDVFEYYFIKLLSGKKFFWVVISFFVLQALWIATSFRYPMLFDEMYHFGVIKIYGNQLSPFIFNQPIQFDTYGNLTYGSASLYHYLLSFPFRLISLLTDSQATQIIFLRYFNILLAAIGFWVYAKIFTTIGIRQIFINLSLLFFSLIPIVTFIAATISYDNLLFPLTAWFMLIGVRLLMSKEPEATDVLQFITIGMLATLVKFTFLPIFAFGMLFIGVVFVRLYRKKIYSMLHKSSESLSVVAKIILVSLLVITSMFFGLRYMVPIAYYGTPIPVCSEILNNERCLTSNVYKYENDAIKSRLDRPVESPQQYGLTWFKSIIMQLDTSASTTPSGIEVGKAMPIFASLMAFGVYIGILLLIYEWKSIEKNIGWLFLATMSLTLIFSVLIFNALSYYKAHLDINTQARYLLTIIPIIMAFSLMALNHAIGSKRRVKIVALITVLILSTQGGGVIKPILNANDGWYWHNKTLKDTNSTIKDVLSPLVQE